MFKRRFLYAWLFSTMTMMMVSFIWHGVVLNDLMHIPTPNELFYALALLVYALIGFALTFVYTYLSMGIGLRMKGSLMGLTAGFFIYLIAFVFGVSFKGSGAEHLVVDFLWQMIEQGFGGAVIGTVYALAKRRDQVLNSDTQ